ncbi:hypothetical protein [Streptomyces sp. NPDC051561]|uniref:hypothetical protein n=1 Tax=Streptomyces sp. NPDC051561 TaxID=3365658 RepID=UPI0037B7D50B
MTTSASHGGQLPLTGLPDAPAPQPAAGRAAVARKTSAAGRPSRPCPDRKVTAGPGPVRVTGSLRIVAPPSGDLSPRANCWCECGFERHAIGRPAVLRLITEHTGHRETCPLRVSEGRTTT